MGSNHAQGNNYRGNGSPKRSQRDVQRDTGPDVEQVPAEKMVPDVKEYMSETIYDPEAIYDPEIWDTPGFTLVLSRLA